MIGMLAEGGSAAADSLSASSHRTAGDNRQVCAKPDDLSQDRTAGGLVTGTAVRGNLVALPSQERPI